MSKGEELIVKLLRKAKINFVQEKIFNDLRKGRYRYDFYIEDYHGRPTIIEFQGQQHYEYVTAFYTNTRQWRAALERDREKISYALANDMDIYLIPYFDAPYLHSAADLFKNDYKAKNRWHNDEVREKLIKSKQ